MPELTLDPTRIDAVVLDAGGVLVLPIHARVRASLASIDVAHHEHDDAFRLAHYEGMRGYDRSSDEPEVWGDYVTAYVRALGVADDHHDVAGRALADVFNSPTNDLWIWVIEETLAALRRLEAAGVPMAVVSNADGHVEAALGAAGVCQVGPGDGVEMVTIVDSTRVGVFKPDPGIFPHALEVLELPAERCVYVGDSVRNDVAGATAAGLHPVHLDPFDLHADATHDRVHDLMDLVDRLLGPS